MKTKLASLVSIEPDSDGPDAFCTVHVTIPGRGDDATPETLFLPVSHPLVWLLRLAGVPWLADERTEGERSPE